VSVFAGSARYYDLFYDRKDYAGEAEYVCGLLRKYAPDVTSVLDLGCGTGRHALCLAEKGFRVVGVDRSTQMLDQAKLLGGSAPAQIQDRLSFHEGDVQTLRLNMEFDAVVALFHVMSYQTTDEALTATIETARTHLRSGGVFLFDCWYGPGVLRDPPQARSRSIDDEGRRILRNAEPKMMRDANVVDVNYDFVVTDTVSGSREEFRETHKMRYFFKPDMFRLLEMHNFEPLACLEWMKNDAPGESAWNAVFIARKSGPAM
jgi:SAM-dependent methyltransferase